MKLSNQALFYLTGLQKCSYIRQAWCEPKAMQELQRAGLVEERQDFFDKKLIWQITAAGRGFDTNA